MDNLFSRVIGDTAEPPGPLPFAATTSTGEPRTDLWGQYEAGHLTLSDLADMDLWPATLDEASFDPETEAPADLVITLNRRWKKVACARGKRPLTADELAARRAAVVAARVEVVNAERDRRLTGGFRYDFGGTIGPTVLQTRDADDKVNWLVSKGIYRDLVAAGQGAQMAARFRSADNVTFLVSVADGLAALVAMETWGAAVLARSWALKDALADGADPAGLDITQGWPD